MNCRVLALWTFFPKRAFLCAVWGVSAMVALAQLSSSAFGQSAQPRPTQPAGEFSELVRSRFLATPPLQLGDVPLTPESPPVSGLSLSQLLAQALEHSPQLQQAQAAREVLESQSKAARADLLPAMSLRRAVGREQSVPSAIADNEFHDYGVNTVRLTQPIYNRFLQLELAAAKKAHDGGAQRFRAARESTILSVVRATVDVLAARLTLQFSDEQLRQLQAILTYLENRAAAGASSQADLERARTRAFNARQTRLEQQTAYRNALHELERLTGQRPRAVELPERAQWHPVQMGRDEILQMALSANAGIQALEREVDAQRHRVEAEFARYQPVLGLSMEHDSSRNVQGSNGKRRDNRALLVMTWSGSLGGKEWHLAQAADAELRQREARLRDEKMQLLQAIEADYSLLESSQLRIEVARLEQQAASRVVEAVSEQLQTGRLASLLEALDASDRLFGARLRLTQSLAQSFKAHAQLLQRAGLLTEEALQTRPQPRP